MDGVAQTKREHLQRGSPPESVMRIKGCKLYLNNLIIIMDQSTALIGAERAGLWPLAQMIR